MRPIGHTCHQAVFGRIDVDVIDMLGKIRLIAYEMFPISPLPYTTLTFVLPAIRAALAMW